MDKLRVLTISGSLRTESYNRKALQVAKSIATDLGAGVYELDLRKLNLPIYDRDIQNQGMPESVQKLKKEIEASDVLILPQPQVLISRAEVAFNLDGSFANPRTLETLKMLIEKIFKLARGIKSWN